MNKVTLIKVNNYLLLITSILMILSGYGITNYQIISKITFGLLDKSSAFRLHSGVGIFFVIFFVIHIMIPWAFKKAR